MDIAMRVNPKDKMIADGRMEKWVLRKAFEQDLPESVVWRQKEQFSDGVGYSWIDTLKATVDREVTADQLTNARYRFPIQTPTSKEEYYYREIFESHFPSDAAARSVPQEPSVACSTKTALEWDEAFKNVNDPSGRAVAKVHAEAYVK
jgi:asparagine synthase (glutamine-hydrolysing)